MGLLRVKPDNSLKANKLFRVSSKESIPAVPPVPLSFIGSFHPSPVQDMRRKATWLASDDRRLLYAYAWHRVFTERRVQEAYRAQLQHYTALQKMQEATDMEIPKELIAPVLPARLTMMTYDPICSALGIDKPTVQRRIKFLKNNRPSAAVDLVEALCWLRHELGVSVYSISNSDIFLSQRSGDPGPLTEQRPKHIAEVLPEVTRLWLERVMATPIEPLTAVANSAPARQHYKPSQIEHVTSADVSTDFIDCADSNVRVNVLGTNEVERLPTATDDAPSSVHATPSGLAPAAQAVSFGLYYSGARGVDLEADADAARGSAVDVFGGAHNDEAVALWKVLRVVVQRSDRLQARIAATLLAFGVSASSTAHGSTSEAALVGMLHELGQYMDVPACFGVLTQKKLISTSVVGGFEPKEKITRGSYLALTKVVDIFCGSRNDHDAYPAEVLSKLLTAFDVNSIPVGSASNVDVNAALFDRLAPGILPRVLFQPVVSCPPCETNSETCLDAGREALTRSCFGESDATRSTPTPRIYDGEVAHASEGMGPKISPTSPEIQIQITDNVSW